MPRPRRWRSQRANRDDDAQPSIRAVSVVLCAHVLDHLARLRCRMLAVLRDPLMSGAVDVVVRRSHLDVARQAQPMLARTAELERADLQPSSDSTSVREENAGPTGALLTQGGRASSWSDR